MKAVLSACILAALTTMAMAQGEKGVAGKNSPSNFDRTHSVIDRTMNTGNDRSPPLGQGRGEQTGIGGSTNFGGGNAPGTQNGPAINQRNQ